MFKHTSIFWFLADTWLSTVTLWVRGRAGFGFRSWAKMMMIIIMSLQPLLLLKTVISIIFLFCLFYLYINLTTSRNPRKKFENPQFHFHYHFLVRSSQGLSRTVEASLSLHLYSRCLEKIRFLLKYKCWHQAGMRSW